MKLLFDIILIAFFSLKAPYRAAILFLLSNVFSFFLSQKNNYQSERDALRLYRVQVSGAIKIKVQRFFSLLLLFGTFAVIIG